MRFVRWTSEARLSYLEYLRQLMAISQPAAVQAERRVEKLLDMLADRPQLGRSSLRWPPYREWSVTSHHKLLVYGSDERMLQVMAFYDTRQDLSAVSPPRPE